MWNTTIFGFEWFYLFYHFFIYSFFGWIYESCLVTFRHKRWVNRGFLNGPVIPIYGVGATVIMMFLEPIKKNYIVVFIGGMIVASLLEFVTSWLMEKLFHAKWWDYSDWRFNIQGRICLAVSVFWGILSVSMEAIFKPGIDRLIADIPRKAGEYGGYVILVLFLADILVTVIATVNLDKKLAELQRLRQEFAAYLTENNKLYGMTGDLIDDWRKRFSALRYQELFSYVRTKLDELAPERDDAADSKMDEGGKLHEWRQELDEWMKQFAAKYQFKLEKTSFVHRRLLRAFPNMKPIGKEGAFMDWLSGLKRKETEKKENKENQEKKSERK